jgi:prepilin-type N-terminal cleavage/methylation domain-containing protein
MSEQLISSLRRRLNLVRGGAGEAGERDGGFTLLEIMISMSLMSVFMALFSGAVLQMYGVSNKVESVTRSSTQLNLAFQRIDKQVRYASAISPPNKTKSAAGAWYVEFDNTSSGADNCYQLRVYNSQLQERSWIGTPTSSPIWIPLASGVTMPATSPFTFAVAAGSQTSQRLKIALSATANSGSKVTTSQTAVSFEAMNSGQGTSPTNDGSSLICQNTGDGGRP